MTMGRKVLAMLGLVVLLATESLALASCLEEASDRELLNEIERRLRGGNPIDEVAYATFTCSSSVLSINLITALGEEYSARQDVGFISQCNDYARLFSSRVAEVSTLRVIAVCDNAVLHKFALTAERLSVLQPEDLNFISACRDEADRINSRL